MEITFDGGKRISAHLNGHVISTDQPIMAGGENSAPTPYELFLASLGTCAGIYVWSFCNQRGIPTDGIKLLQNMEFNRQTGLPTLIGIDIQLPADFPAKYKDSVIHVAELCKVKQTMEQPPEFKVTTSVNEE